MKTQQKSETKSERPSRTAEQRFHVQVGKEVRQLTDADKPEATVYHILPRYADSKAAPEVVAGLCPLTNTKFVAYVPPTKQKDGTWKATLSIHPVALRRILIAKDRRASRINLVLNEQGAAAAALWGAK